MIQNEYKVTRKLFMAWGLENAFKGSQLAFSIIYLALAILMLVLEGINIITGLLIAFCAYRALLRWYVVSNGQYRRLVKNHNSADWMRTISFGENEITIDESAISLKYQYADIISIKEKGNKVWLTARNKTVIRLYKDCFKNGTWEGCKAHIAKRAPGAVK